jgi:glucose/arabinose dehydrogenase
MNLIKAATLLAMTATAAHAQVNASDFPILNAVVPKPVVTGSMGPAAQVASMPFNLEKVATYNFPWRLNFLPDGRMLITEKTGKLWLATQAGARIEVTNVPASTYRGMGGMLGVFVSPTYATNNDIYLTYAEPGDIGPSLAVARGKLVVNGGTATFADWKVIWRDPSKNDSASGNFGAQIAFDPDGQHFFLASGDRMRYSPAQDRNVPLGKVLRLTLDGKPAAGNPWEGQVGTPTMLAVARPDDTDADRNPRIVRTIKLDGPNLTPAETWTLGHRSIYGLAFAPDGKLWELEHGPNGGDELNLIEKGKNYGWPIVSYGKNYNGKSIQSPDTRPDLAPAAIYWVPSIAPGGMSFYKGAMFPQWEGSLLVSGLGGRTLNRLAFDANGMPTPAERWAMGFRVRDVKPGPDGALWLIEDAAAGGVYRMTPK